MHSGGRVAGWLVFINSSGQILQERCFPPLSQAFFSSPPLHIPLPVSTVPLTHPSVLSGSSSSLNLRRGALLSESPGARGPRPSGPLSLGHPGGFCPRRLQIQYYFSRSRGAPMSLIYYFTPVAWQGDVSLPDHRAGADFQIFSLLLVDIPEPDISLFKGDLPSVTTVPIASPDGFLTIPHGLPFCVWPLSTCAHVCVHTHTHTPPPCTHMYTHTCTHTHLHTHLCTHTRTRMPPTFSISRL